MVYTKGQGYSDPWAMLQAMRRASVASAVDYVNQGVAGFRLGAPNRIDAVVLDSGAEGSVSRVECCLRKFL